METYEIMITETSVRVTEYTANSLEEAIKMAEHDYLNGKIVLDHNDLYKYEITEN